MQGVAIGLWTQFFSMEKKAMQKSSCILFARKKIKLYRQAMALPNINYIKIDL